MKYNFYIGTYTRGRENGIYQGLFDSETGGITPVKAYPSAEPSYLVRSHRGDTLYAVQEHPLTDSTVGQVQAWRVNADRTITFLNTLSTDGGFPCHLTVAPNDKFLYAANYQDGTAAAFTLNSDGSLGERCSLLRHTGAGPDPDRQECAHLHCARFTPDDKYIALCDLGLDRVSLHPFDPLAGWGEEKFYVNCAPGAGARHIIFSADERFAYLICEMGNTVEVFAYTEGVLTPLQTVSTLPADFAEPNTAAAVHIAPDGKHLTVSNRGHDSLCTYDIASDGTLENPRFVKTEGICPREFSYTPDESWLLVANQEEGGITVFQVDAATGDLKNTGLRADIPYPTCILF